MKRKDKLKKIIKQQDEIIGRLTRENESLTKSVIARKDWLRKAKEEAEYHNSVSFDIVWKEILNKAKANEQN